MTPQQLIDWRKRLGLTAKAAAEALGLSINGYAAYERGYQPFGHSGHVPRPIPRHVALACMALEALDKPPPEERLIDCLSERTKNCLHNADIPLTADALSSKSDPELLLIDGIGLRSLNEIRRVVAATK